MRYHVITPFSRFENLKPMVEMLSDQMANQGQDKFTLDWSILLDNNLPFAVSVPAKWVTVFYFPPAQPFWRAWSKHLNGFIKQGFIWPKDRYIILNDDDFAEPGFFAKLDKRAGEFLVCSMQRGQHVATGGHNHPTDTLIASPENMNVGRVGCEQMIVSGQLFKTITFADHLCADGMAIVELSKRHPPVFVPEANVLFNYLEPGRWDKNG